MTGQIIVLGWDALDYDLIREWDLADAFGPQTRRIETFENPVLGEPHTRELWPSIITGQPPEEHGIWAATDEDGIEWDDPLIDAASRVAQDIVPKDIRVQFGKRLRDRGAEVAQHDVDYYEDLEIETIFDGRHSRTISVPNYRHDRDTQLGITIDRTAIWQDVLRTVDTEEKTLYRPLVDLDVLDEHLFAKLYRRLGVVESSHQREFDIVFCWFGYLDTVGHLAPVVDEMGFQRRHYETAARITRNLRERIDDEDTLICLSDHGLQNGEHTHAATVGSPDQAFVNDVSSVLDFASALNRHYPTGEVGDGRVRDQAQRNGSADEQSIGEVRDRLKRLGYL